jgi:phosphate/sulfate permease
MILAIVAGFVLGYVLIIKVVNVAGSWATPRANRLFKLLQVFSSVGLVLAYGANDADRIADAADIMGNIIIKDM